MNKRRLITSALPYVNNIPHLGNLIQVLSADVFARYCRSNNYETLYICGTDEYGTATETRALQEGITPKELCDQYYTVHSDIYKWFNIQFDKFGRTSTPEHTKIVQSMFKDLSDNGYVVQKDIQQLYSEKSQMFLADRYVKGTCPKCKDNDARGDQCNNCGALLDSLELIKPISIVDDTTPIVKNTSHLYINLPKILPKLEAWVQHAKEHKLWSKNAIKMTEAWIRDGIQERTITRDLKWGIPVPQEGFESKVFYVWFDAPIGYISITATFTDAWEAWWKQADDVQLYQFIGKDNIPFHTVVFPATLLGSGQEWTMLHKISSTEYLNYEGGMFSKSKGIGIFGNDVLETGISSDVWRFYMMYNRPESSDYLFTWKDFQETVNGELINNLSNLYNRTLTFITKYFDSKVDAIDLQDVDTKKIWGPIFTLEQEITELFEKIEIRQAYLKIFALSDYANKLLQDYEPWKLRSTDPKKASWVLSNLVYILRELSILIEPFTPNMAAQIAKTLDITLPTWKDLLYTNDTHILESITSINRPTLLFKRLEEKVIETFKEKFSGSQDEREEKSNNKAEKKKQEKTALPIDFANTVSLKAAKITKVTPHPDADKLYVLQLDDGSEEGRTIVSGIKDFYTTNELVDRHIIVVANLKPAKLRGIISNGMLLAASGTRQDGSELVEVLFVDDIPAGTKIFPQGEEVHNEYSIVKVDRFFDFTLATNSDKVLCINDTPFVADIPYEQFATSLILADAPVG